MAEFIGSRISLISKSDIRYVGTLHEINSDNSTVALENVSSFGTEGRKGIPEEEIPSSDNVYEYIIFRGSDVKDLRIEEPPKENQPPPPPQVPNDPAILGSGARPRSQNDPQQMPQPPSGPRQQQPPFQHQQGPFPYQQNQQYPQQRFGGPQGQPGFPPPPNGYGYPQGPPGQQGGFYGGPPPGFYPPPGQGFSQPPGPFPQHGQGQYPGPPYSQPPHQQQGGGQGSTPPKQQTPPAGTDLQSTVKNKPTSDPQVPTAPKADRGKSQTSTPIPNPATAPPPPVESKPDVASAIASTATKGQGSSTVAPAPKSNRVVPAVPLMKPNAARTAPAANASQVTASKSGDAAANAALQYQNATQAATAAVAAAMAKLPGATGQKTRPGETSAVDNLTQKVNEMRVDDRNRNQQRGGYTSRGRGRGRGGHTRGVEVPNTDFDFESSNAKFNKEDLAKEATVASPGGESPAMNGADKNEDEPADVVIPPAQSYNKSSFYDNISSDARDREEAPGANRGAEFRGEERKRNLETFGMGNVDGYRGGHRGRGRGRGGYRGRGSYGSDGGFSRGRGGYRGRGGSMTTTES